MNCKSCGEALIDEKRLWKKFCGNRCKADFEDKTGKKPAEKTVDDGAGGEVKSTADS